MVPTNQTRLPIFLESGVSAFHRMFHLQTPDLDTGPRRSKADRAQSNFLSDHPGLQGNFIHSHLDKIGWSSSHLSITSNLLPLFRQGIYQVDAEQLHCALHHGCEQIPVLLNCNDLSSAPPCHPVNSFPLHKVDIQICVSIQQKER